MNRLITEPMVGQDRCQYNDDGRSHAGQRGRTGTHHRRTLSTTCMTLLMSSLALLLVSARTDRDIMLHTAGTPRFWCSNGGRTAGDREHARWTTASKDVCVCCGNELRSKVLRRATMVRWLTRPHSSVDVPVPDNATVNNYSK